VQDAMNVRFVIEVNKTPRTVFRVSEQKSGDLNLHITSGGRDYAATTLYDLIAVNDDSVFENCDKHISIHTSPNSLSVNVVKRTQEFVDRVVDICQVTTGIKQDNLFVPVLFRVCGDLSRSRYTLDESCKDQLVTLGQYDPRQGQLRFMAVCSRRGTSFPKDKEHPSNLLEFQFSNFTLTVLWSYFNKPSHAYAIDFFLGTKKESGPIKGFDWFEIYNLYTDLYMVHAAEYFRIYGDE
jgi:hypothetical protein